METQFHDFLKSDRVLDYLQAHPDGPKVLNALRMLGHGLRHGDPRLVHIDSHPGNILWKGERISVVIDWGRLPMVPWGLRWLTCIRSQPPSAYRSWQ